MATPDRDELGGPSGRTPGIVWRFADCEFDERRRELRVRGVVVDLEVKPLGILQQLLHHAGEVVTKAELLESVWPGVIVVEGSLTNAISKLRKALADDESVIVTVPRVGYKLAAPVYCTRAEGSAAPSLHLEAGQTVPGRPQWRMARRLGLSPSNDVWLAEHLKTQETRVFKFASDEKRLKGLKREVTVARLVRESVGERPGFVRLLEWNFETSPYFLESEYAGPNLAEWAEAQGGIGCVPLDVRLTLLADAARAVATAHEVDVLHKDLKPGNILVATLPDGTPQVRVADFGSSSLLTRSRLDEFGITNLGFTQTAGDGAGSLTGTPIYVAPEVLAGQSATAASDVYSLGVLLYQLVVGDFRRPFAPGWEADVTDPLLREDIAVAASGDPSRRLASAASLADRVRSLDRRRLDEQEAQEAQRAAVRRQATAAVRRRWAAVAGVGVAVVALLAFVASRPSTPPASRSRTIAVLPFENTDSNAAFDFLRLALGDVLANSLSRARGLAVRPFSITSTYDTREIDVQRAGAAVGADTLLIGRFRTVEDQMQIALEAIDVESASLLWRDTIEAPARSMIATHVQMALTIRGGLVPALGATVTDEMPEPRSNEAYELYLRSSVLPYDPGPNPQAVAMLERAVELDPAYAPAWLSLARRYYVEGHFGSGDPAMLERALATAERGIALDPDDIDAGGVLATIHIERGDVTGAYTRAEDLVRRRPDHVVAQFIMSYVLRYAGLLEESAAHCERAFLADRQPVNTTLRSCALVFSVRGDFTRALNYLNLDRESEVGKAFRVDTLVRQGRTEAALEIGVPELPQWRARYEMLFACIRRGPPEEIEALARDVQAAVDPEENYLSAAHLSYCGQMDAAAELLRRAVEGNYCSFPAIDSDPLFANLRATGAYAAVREAGRACQDRFLSQRERGPSS
jgi:DNA-binding winged helix-turn-helix (wHTH) protein/serine/threonine protein kinase